MFSSFFSFQDVVWGLNSLFTVSMLNKIPIVLIPLSAGFKDCIKDNTRESLNPSFFGTFVSQKNSELRTEGALE